jgi:hypothetical protein
LETIKKAEEYVKPYLARTVYYDKVNIINIVVGLAICFVVSIIVGITKHWAYSVIFIIIFCSFAYA